MHTAPSDTRTTPSPPKPERALDWVNVAFIGSAHLLAAAALVYLVTVRFSGWTLLLGLVWGALCGVSITGGYHRLFAHRSYRARASLRLLYLLFGAASVQNSALKWASDHRRHHSKTDRDEDPYNIQKGFWWAHIVWIFYRDEGPDESSVKDLLEDPLVRFQHRHYLALAVLGAVVLPAALGCLWGDPLGAVLVAGFLRLVVQWHATFSVNSVAHTIGRRTYSREGSARDSFVTALLTMGEGYHSYHHRFQADYRNGIRWYQFDPTKWWIWTLSHLGLTRDLRRTPRHAIERAREAARAA